MNIVQSFIFNESGKQIGAFSQEQSLQGGEDFHHLRAYTAQRAPIQQLAEVSKTLTGVFITLAGGTYLGSIRRIQAPRSLYIVDIYKR
ncbi:hypothetical protein FJM67_05935 [Maribrevibacterium harenarium]|uniref:Uncharacterized protein n=1 Tax=Maribrevibacterium harenarium TaxID=2589817 RepID=A0A501WZ48_9GAMM|nr:hypothetical protein [Maribrevibacterium harenarium]TPE54152.1 hypothetical protein FJM67_05935 [Maribrevibacterium harenarium]